MLKNWRVASLVYGTWPKQKINKKSDYMLLSSKCCFQHILSHHNLELSQNLRCSSLSLWWTLSHNASMPYVWWKSVPLLFNMLNNVQAASTRGQILTGKKHDASGHTMWSGGWHSNVVHSTTSIQLKEFYCSLLPLLANRWKESCCNYYILWILHSLYAAAAAALQMLGKSD